MHVHASCILRQLLASACCLIQCFAVSMTHTALLFRCSYNSCLHPIGWVNLKLNVQGSHWVAGGQVLQGECVRFCTSCDAGSACVRDVIQLPGLFSFTL